MNNFFFKLNFYLICNKYCYHSNIKEIIKQAMENISTGIFNFSIMSQDIFSNQIDNQIEKNQKRKFQQTIDVSIQLRKSRTYKKICRDNVLITN